MWFLGTFVIPKDGYKIITIKANLSDVGTVYPGTEGALIQIDNDADGLTYGTRMSSGTIISHKHSAAGGTDTAVAGVRMFNSFPILERLSLSSNILSNGTKSLYKFKVAADAADDISLYKFSFAIATSSVNAYSFSLVETDTGKTVFRSVEVAGGVVEGVVDSAQYGATQITIPAGSSHIYELKATITNAGGAGDALSVALMGDVEYPVVPTPAGYSVIGTVANIIADGHDNMIWSPNTYGISSPTDFNWTNGFGLPGLPPTNMVAQVISAQADTPMTTQVASVLDAVEDILNSLLGLVSI